MPVLDGISAAERIAAEHIAPVVILTAFSQRELVERARDAGAMAYLVKPFTKADLVPAIEIAVSRFQEVTALEGEVGTLKERLEVRKLLDRAKGKLQTEHGLTEPDAFRWIQKTSMDQRMAMRAVAERVLDGRHVPGGRRGRECGSAALSRRLTWDSRRFRREPGEPLVPCRPSPGRHVLYSAPRALPHHGSETLPWAQRARTFPGQFVINAPSRAVSPVLCLVRPVQRAGRGRRGRTMPNASAWPVHPGAGQPPRVMAWPPGGAWSRSRQVSRAVHTRRPWSSLITIS